MRAGPGSGMPVKSDFFSIRCCQETSKNFILENTVAKTEISDHRSRIMTILKQEVRNPKTAHTSGVLRAKAFMVSR